MVTVRIKGNTLSRFERDVLVSSACSAMLPAGITVDDEEEVIIYDSSGYISLAEIRTEHIADYVKEMELITAALICCREHMLNPDRVILEPESIFIPESGCGSGGRIKLLYGVEKSDLPAGLAQLSEKLGRGYVRKSTEYIGRVKETVLQYGYNLQKLRKNLLELLIEIENKGIV